jgi:hypothetical protein
VATQGELLAAELSMIVDREGACLGATVLRNAENGTTAVVGSELPGASAKIDEYLAIGFSPIGVFVVTRIDDLSMRTLILTSKSVSEPDQPFVKELIHEVAKSFFPDLPEERIAKA